MFFAGEIYDVEPIAIAQGANSKKKRGSRLLHLSFLGHRAAGVENENNIFVDQLSLRDVIRGRRRWARGVLTLAVLGLLVLAGIGVAHASETWGALVTWFRTRF